MNRTQAEWTLYNWASGEFSRFVKESGESFEIEFESIIKTFALEHFRSEANVNSIPKELRTKQGFIETLENFEVLLIDLFSKVVNSANAEELLPYPEDVFEDAVEPITIVMKLEYAASQAVSNIQLTA